MLGDNSTEAGAQAMATDIETYWQDRGYTITATVERMGYSRLMRGAYFGVRSNMVSGRPVRDA